MARLWTIIIWFRIEPIELLEIYPDGKYIIVGLRYRIPREELRE
jgi:hypothetical protein